MAETGRLAPEKIIERKHAEAAFNYIRERNRQEEGIRYYKTRPNAENAWVVDFGGEAYYHQEALKLSYLFALREMGEIKNEEPPFPVAYKKHIPPRSWLEANPIERIWESIDLASRRYKDIADNEHNGEHQSIFNDIVSDDCNLLRQFRQVIFHGPPGTGKTYSAKKVLESLFNVDKEKLRDMQGENWNIIQFHPSYNYEDFVRGIKVETHDNQIMYKTVNRVFGEMCERANKDKFNDYALIIDEINRANVSAVLGELIYALEYRGEKIKTPYAIDGDADIVIPKNLYIIGTMNTADRTIGQIDYAVRRRFAFLHCPPDKSVIEGGEARDLFDKVNGIFGKLHLSPDFHADDIRIGHSYFLDDDDFAYKVLYQVVPILQEYVKDGVLLPSAEDIIEEIRKYAEGLLRHTPAGEETSVDEDDDDEISETSRKQYFYWRYRDDDKRLGVGGVGRTAFGVIKDFIQNNPQMDVDAINDTLRIHKRTFVYTEDDLLEDSSIRYFKKPSISHQGKKLFVFNQWGATAADATLWSDFKDKMKSHGYSIGLCHLVNLGEGNGDNPSRTWEDCFKYKIVSGRGVGYPTAVGNLKKGDLLFVRIAESSDSHTGYVACAEVEEEKTHIAEVRAEGGELLAETIVGNGQTYHQKYPTAFDEEYPDYAVKVKWIDHKPRNEVIRGISTSVLSFRVSKIQMKDFRVLRTAFGIPGWDK